jgi:hypothetical protein
MLLTAKTANAERVREVSQAAVIKMTNLIRDGSYLKEAHAFCVVLVPTAHGADSDESHAQRALDFCEGCSGGD